MKIRNGFVSNSSSSSFILGYPKGKKVEGADEVLDLILNSDEDILLNLRECGEGEDIFDLSRDMKRLVERFPNDFLKGISKLGEYRTVDGEWKYVHVEPIAYVGAILQSNEFWGSWDDKEGQEKEDERVKKSIGSRVKDAEFEQHYVDRNNCGDEWSSLSDFVERYFNTEWSDDYYGCERTKYFNVSKTAPYGIAYSFCTRDKNEILEYLGNKDRCLKGLIARSNVIYEYIEHLEDDYDAIDLDLFELGEKEKEAVLKDKEGFLNGGEVIYYYNADLINEITKDKVVVGQRRLDMYFGRASVTGKGKGMKALKDTFFKEKDDD